MVHDVPLTLDFGDITLEDPGRVGRKNASLGGRSRTLVEVDWIGIAARLTGADS